MLISAIRRLAFVATFGFGLWLISKIAAERADRRHLSCSSAPWPSVPLDGLPLDSSPLDSSPLDSSPLDSQELGPAKETVTVIPDAGEETGGEPTQGQPQTVALSHSNQAISLPLGRRDQSDPVAWVEPDSGSCPLDHPVKAKLTSHLYHEPGMNAYRRTHADRCYADAAGAEEDGFVRAKR